MRAAGTAEAAEDDDTSRLLYLALRAGPRSPTRINPEDAARYYFSARGGALS